MDPLTIQNTLRVVSGVGQLGGSPEIQLVNPPAGPNAAKEPSFQQTLSQFLDEVNKTVLAADQGMADLAAGKSQNIHNTLIAMQKADLQVRLLIETRNKVINAYQEIMRMQA